MSSWATPWPGHNVERRAGTGPLQEGLCPLHLGLPRPAERPPGAFFPPTLTTCSARVRPTPPPPLHTRPLSCPSHKAVQSDTGARHSHTPAPPLPGTQAKSPL